MKKTKMLLVASLLCGFTAAHADDNVVTATYGNAVGNTTRTMTVALNHEKDYVAFHLVMDVPSGTTVKGVTAKSPLKNGGTVDLSTKGGTANESTDFKVPFNQDGTKCNIVGYNYGNEKIVGDNGAILLTVTLETAQGINYDATGVTTACTFVDANSEEFVLGSPVTEARLWGDVVKNGVVDVADYQATANIVLKKSNGTALIDTFAGDTDQSGSIDVTDYQTISNIILKK